MQITWAKALDVGARRKENQDAVGVFWPGWLSIKHQPLWVLADGMGGYAGGALAARLVVTAMLRRHRRLIPHLPADESLRLGVLDAHRAVCSAASHQTQQAQMGSTVAAVTLMDEAVFGINVGDSRIYHLRGENLRQVSRDQSLVGELIAAGAITREEARSHPQRNQLNMSISAKRSQVTPYSFQCEWQTGDRLLLCSDGLWSIVSDAGIMHFLTEFPPDQAASGLVKQAYTCGAPDNISIIIIQAGL